ncbi:hypothetical protein ACOSQ4_013358 [Xanthoceras sorbifolium]
MKSRGNKSREDKYGPSSNSVGVPGADGLEKQIIPTAGSGKRGAENSVTTKVLEGNQKNMDADMEGLEEAHQLAFKPEEGVVTGQIDVGELGCEGQAHQLAFKPEEGVVTGQIAVGELGCEGQVYAEPKSPPIKTTGRKWKRAARKGPNSNVLSGLPSPIQRILSARKIAKGRGRHGSASPVKRSPTCNVTARDALRLLPDPVTHRYCPLWVLYGVGPHGFLSPPSSGFEPGRRKKAVRADAVEHPKRTVPVSNGVGQEP